MKGFVEQCALGHLETFEVPVRDELNPRRTPKCQSMTKTVI